MLVEEVEKGILNKDQIKRKYNIGGKSTVLNWFRRYRRLNSYIMVEEINEPKTENERLSELENENKRLKEKILGLETLIEVADSMYIHSH